MDLKTPLKELSPVFRMKAKLLTKLGIEIVEDLLLYAPFRYEDSSLTSKINILQAGESITIKGAVMQTSNIFTRKRGLTMQKVTVDDGTGRIDCIFFNQKFILNNIHKDDFLSASGRVQIFGRKKSLIVKNYEVLEDLNSVPIHTGRIVPVYSQTQGLSAKWIRGRIKFILDKISLEEYLPQPVIKQNNLMPFEAALNAIHFPRNFSDAESAVKRLSFDELFQKHLASLKRKKEWEEKQKGTPFEIEKYLIKIDELIKDLSFELTSSQKKALAEICEDLKKSIPMNRLLEGDVGSGKTIVATIAMYLAYLNGFQSALMAPTEILANQHFETIRTILEPFGVQVQLFTGSRKPAKTKDSKLKTEKKDHRSEVLGPMSTFNIAIGTHALIQSKVSFEKLGLVVIDEQQRFGVEQRAIIREKGKNPHLVTMTATPIPRTIFLTIYADLSLSVLSEMPKGRKKIKTWLVPEEKRENAYKWIEKKVTPDLIGVKKEKSQVFIVCPFIEPSETLNTVKAAKEEFDRLKKDIFPNSKLGLLHGRMKSQEKEKCVQDFREGKINILVATPVIEVGIDIPTADIIVIEAAERFGLAQLHQLRGRVGRGEKESFCLLFSGSNSDKTKERLTLLQTLNDGTKLAEADLKLRGPGEMFGTMQHGIPGLKIASFSDYELIKKSREAAEEIFPNLSSYPNLIQKVEETNIPKISRD